jgi:hypothetical protein
MSNHRIESLLTRLVDWIAPSAEDEGRRDAILEWCAELVASNEAAYDDINLDTRQVASYIYDQRMSIF